MAAVVVARTRRRARLASCLAAAGERPTTLAISSNVTPNMSCSTKASRSGGSSRSRQPITRAQRTPPEATPVQGRRRRARRARMGFVQRLFSAPRARPQHVQANPSHNGRQPSAEVFYAAGIRSTEPQPGFLNRVIGFADRPQHPGRLPPAGVPGSPQISAPAIHFSREDRRAT